MLFWIIQRSNAMKRLYLLPDIKLKSIVGAGTLVAAGQHDRGPTVGEVIKKK